MTFPSSFPHSLCGMVRVQRATRSDSKCGKVLSLVLFVCAIVVVLVNIDNQSPTTDLNNNLRSALHTVEKKNDPKKEVPRAYYESLGDLAEEERFPRKGSRHMVDPPKGGKVSLVHCDTTAGPWSILVHHRWAPLGAQRFMEMVESGYFSNQVPLMRCIHNFLCQFGLAGSASKEFRKSIQDDPNWLPEGKDHRENEDGVRRFAKGYMAYAGSGKNSRGNQLIVANHPNKFLAGGSPWEVPWGELVGAASFETLDKIYTGYGEKGPAQGKLHNEGHLEWVKRDFPKLDIITSCRVLDEETQPTE